MRLGGMTLRIDQTGDAWRVEREAGDAEWMPVGPEFASLDEAQACLAGVRLGLGFLMPLDGTDDE